MVSADGKIEKVMAAAQGISASTAQLVVASRVKAERGSNSLDALQTASRGVTQATAGVLTNAKACVQLVEQSGIFLIIIPPPPPPAHIFICHYEVSCKIWSEKKNIYICD